MQEHMRKFLSVWKENLWRDPAAKPDQIMHHQVIQEVKRNQEQYLKQDRHL